MQGQDTQVSFAGQDVYVAINVAIKSWKVCIYVGQLFHKRFARPPDPGALVQYLRRALPDARYHSVYEAGYFGFWIHEALGQLGIDSMVINPAAVPTSDKERRTKTDRVDATKLARSLANGELHRLYVPERRALEDQRSCPCVWPLCESRRGARIRSKPCCASMGSRRPREEAIGTGQATTSGGSRP